jgi:catalase
MRIKKIRGLVVPEAFEGAGAIRLQDERNKKRTRQKQITYDCLKAKVTEAHRVVCQHTDRGLPLLAVLRGMSMGACHSCLLYQDDGREG